MELLWICPIVDAVLVRELGVLLLEFVATFPGVLDISLFEYNDFRCVET